MKVYCSWRWIVGMLGLIVSLAIHINMLKYLDLTLLGANAITGLLAVTFFSI